MKFSKVLSLSLVAAAVMFTSCASKGIKGTGAEMAANKPVIIDYKGQSLGANLPGWVLDANDGKKKEVAKGLGLSDKKIWILQNKGKDLDILKIWTDQVDARAEITSGLEQTVADLVTANFEGSDDEKSRAVKRFSSRITNMTINGLEKEADYWTLGRSVKPGLKKAKSADDYIDEYSYMVVFSMDNKLWDKQVKAAMDDMDENDDQSLLLRDMITSKLMDELELYTSGE